MVDLTQFNELMKKEVSRQEFLRYVGVLLLGAIGVTNLLKNLSSPPAVQTTTKHITKTTNINAGGYGYSAYGR